MMTELDQELTKVFGAPKNWTSYIRSAARRMARNYSKNAAFDDIVTTIITEFFLNANKGKLGEALEKAKSNSHNEQELVENVSGVVWQATKYRAGTERKKIEYHQDFCLPFDGVCEDKLVIHHDDIPLEEYQELIVQELHQMAANVHERLAKRYLLAAKIVAERINSRDKAKELMEKYSISGKATWRKITLDIGQAIVAVGKKTNNPWLCETTQKRMDK